MIRSVLIANRGEIARRIIRTARRLGVRSIAVYSEADAGAPHVREADEAILIGPSPPRESYLVAERILAAARESGAEAIHPGYGFLSENADFAEAVKAAGLVWIGPPPAAIRAMGLKDAAKRLMAEAGVPVTPGYLGDDQDAARLAKEAAAIGWPVLIKAVAGGGGKGMRKVLAAGDFSSALDGARREAASAFGDDRVLLEQFVSRPRHIEVQVFGDSHGNVVHLFERDCSLQRRHQKVIEEAPAPGMDPATREALTAAAVRAARAVAYEGAGTVEFIADASQGLRADRIWFMEMNTRLQVEHPVTEAVTGLDLVEWQMRVASGDALPLAQDQIKLTGHAVEARLYAEDPAKGFLPSVGNLDVFDLPADVRCDSAVEAGSEVSPYYDPMLAKLIAWGPNRDDAVAALAGACGEARVWPVKTNAWFLARCLSDEDFIGGEIDTGFIETRLAALTEPPKAAPAAVATAAATIAREAVYSSTPAEDPWQGGLLGFRVNGASTTPLRLFEGGVAIDTIISGTGPGFTVQVGGQAFRAEDARAPAFQGLNGETVVFDRGAALAFRRTSPAALDVAAGTDGAIRSPMPGKIVLLSARAGDRVTKGQPLVTLEAMKMEHTLLAPLDGEIAEVNVAAGDQVSEGAILVRLEPTP